MRALHDLELRDLIAIIFILSVLLVGFIIIFPGYVIWWLINFVRNGFKSNHVHIDSIFEDDN